MISRPSLRLLWYWYCPAAVTKLTKLLSRQTCERITAQVFVLFSGAKVTPLR